VIFRGTIPADVTVRKCERRFRWKRLSFSSDGTWGGIAVRRGYD
jgi:hypothetical protein